MSKEEQDFNALLAEQDEFFRSGAPPAAQSRRIGKQPNAHKRTSFNNPTLQNEKNIQMNEIDGREDVISLDRLKVYEKYNTEESFELPQHQGFRKEQSICHPSLNSFKSEGANLANQDVHNNIPYRNNNSKLSICDDEIPSDIGSVQDNHVNKSLPALELVRFDFEGIPLSKDKQASLPTYIGLHHHGEDPLSAGYNFREISMLIRSSVPSQKAISLRILLQIIRHAKLRKYVHYGITEDILSYLVEKHRICISLCMALRDPNRTVWFTALQAVHCLLIFAQEEMLKKKLNEISLETTEIMAEKSSRFKLKLQLLEGNLIPALSELLQFDKRSNVLRPILEILVELAGGSVVLGEQISNNEAIIDTLQSLVELDKVSSEEGNETEFESLYPIIKGLLFRLAKLAN